MQKTLDQVVVGAQVVIDSFLDEGISLRLLEMGFLPGEKVEVSHISPLGDPIAITVSGYTLSLRKKEAATILVK